MSKRKLETASLANRLCNSSQNLDSRRRHQLERIARDQTFKAGHARSGSRGDVVGRRAWKLAIIAGEWQLVSFSGTARSATIRLSYLHSERNRVSSERMDSSALALCTHAYARTHTHTQSRPSCDGHLLHRSVNVVDAEQFAIADPRESLKLRQVNKIGFDSGFGLRARSSFLRIFISKNLLATVFRIR